MTSSFSLPQILTAVSKTFWRFSRSFSAMFMHSFAQPLAVIMGAPLIPHRSMGYLAMHGIPSIVWDMGKPVGIASCNSAGVSFLDAM
eukprot:4637907-Lingulodinium_polyedra.AAC.1